MAGSMKWFKYTTDFGDIFGINMDESNGEAIGNSDYDGLDGVIRFSVPSNVKPRMVTYRSVDGKQSTRIPVCDPAATILTLPGAIVRDGVAMALTQFVGEQYNPIPNPLDTGLDDGDAT